MKKFFISILLTTSLLFAQELISYNGSGTYILKERTDLRRYDNGKYVGLMSREVSSYITPVKYENGYLYDGNFFVLQQTKRASVNVAQGINDAISSSFKIDEEGNITMLIDNGYPSFRSFPSYPKTKVNVGESWSGQGERAVDPLNKGIPTKIPMYIQYTYTGDSNFNNQDVYVLKAQWATRYGDGIYDPTGDYSLKSARGSHNASIYVSKATGNALVIRDTVDELFSYSDGKQIALKGTISLFTEYPPSVETEKLLPALKRLASIDENSFSNPVTKTEPVYVAAASGSADPYSGTVNTSSWVGPNNAKTYTRKPKDSGTKALISQINSSGKNSVKVEETNAGLKLTIENLQFKANSSELLPGEEERLNKIAEVLKAAPKNQFLIEGHTADTGNPNGELQLSIERSHAIAGELAKRGIDSSKFICKGCGGTKPVADNSTPEGRAKNRRVEITILE